MNPQESSLYNSLYNETGDRESSENIDTQEDTEPEVNSNGSYQSFYRLVKNGELEVTKVTIPQETMEKMRGGTLSELRFSNARKGNLWIINWHDVYCLIPQENININQYQYGNFQRVFDCQNYQETYSDFEVIEPATVFNCDGNSWQLERKGKIRFICETIKKANNVKNEVRKETEIDLKTKLYQFRKTYNQDKKLILDRIVAKVVITVETLENITCDRHQDIILENTPHGKYWIINYLDIYCLIPSENNRTYHYKPTDLITLRTLFNFSGYYLEYSICQLIRPAIVTKISSKQWKLEEKGKFIFS